MNCWKHWMLLGLLLAGRPAAGPTNGIFADFSTTKGAFTVWLDYERAPRAVASFVGLATGEGGWLDSQSNVWHRPFYAGSLFHRVVKDAATNGIAIQGGGRSWETAATVDRPVATGTESYTGRLTVTNAAGVTTNLLNLPVTTTNPPAVATNFVLNGQVLATNAPMLTLVRIDARVVSSNSLVAALTNRATLFGGYTNFTLAPVATTRTVQVAVVITNSSGTNLATVHAIEVQTAVSNILRAPAVATNFLNAGYTLLESVTNGLLHSNGVISMANSGPNTDGSQFFITTTDVTNWNGGYSVFGHVTTGMNVVTSIAAVAVQGSGSRPVEDILLSNVVIRRIGAAAETFDPAAQGVPAPESAPMRVGMAGTNAEIAVEVAPQTKPLMFSDTTNVGAFADWTHGTMLPGLTFYTNAAVTLTQTVDIASLGARHFFHASRIRYPVSLTAPAGIRGRKFTFWWNTTPAVKYEATFASNWWVQGQFAVTSSVSTNGIIYVGDSWERDAYSGRLYFMDSTLKEYSYSLGFNPGQVTNRFSGYWWTYGSTVQYPISGVFTLQ